MIGKTVTAAARVAVLDGMGVAGVAMSDTA